MSGVPEAGAGNNATNIGQVLVDNSNIAPVTTVEEDMKQCLGA